VTINRVWSMPSADTFDIAPIAAFVRKYLGHSMVSIDPFARDKRWATHTNDLDPSTSAEYHMDAVKFLGTLKFRGVRADLAIVDPPYSPTQIARCYKSLGIPVGKAETQNARLYRDVREALLPLLNPGATVLSFGWNSSGMGTTRGFTPLELLLVCHGGAHNDTICLAERLLP
jgi:hypothetical protein